MSEKSCWLEFDGLRILDVGRAQLIDVLDAEFRRQTPSVALDLHVSSLLHRLERPYQRAVYAADVVYADGVSVALLARLNGARSLERAPLTEFGHELLDEFVARHGRITIALLGGPAGLAKRAGRVLSVRHGLELVFAETGFVNDWSGVLERLRETAPDVLFIGLGIPLEAVWVEQHRSELPPTLVLTCGGWFEKVVGDERRAPRLLSSLGLEWAWRLLRHPRRLWSRYLRGGIVFIRLSCSAVARRLRKA